MCTRNRFQKPEKHTIADLSRAPNSDGGFVAAEVEYWSKIGSPSGLASGTNVGLTVAGVACGSSASCFGSRYSHLVPGRNSGGRENDGADYRRLQMKSDTVNSKSIQFTCRC